MWNNNLFFQAMVRTRFMIAWKVHVYRSMCIENADIGNVVLNRLVPSSGLFIMYCNKKH
jgi:hypothetical protein